MAKTKAAAKPHSGAAVRVAYDLLCSLLGKQVDDPAVTAMIAKAGKVTVKPDFIIAKEAGFDFSVGRPPGAKKKVLTSLFLFRDGKDGHRGYPDLPAGFAFTTRSELLAKLPPPQRTFKIGRGEVPVTTADVSHDTWAVDGRQVVVSYRDGSVGDINVSLPEDEMGGRDLSTHPLHFESRPPDAPNDADLVGMALLVAWAAIRHGLPAKHAASPLGKQLLAREITPREFLVGACAKTLTTLDVAPALGDFLYGYTHRLFTARDAANAAIAKLLHLHRDDERAYTDDFLGTFKHAVGNPFHVPDRWAAVDRITPVLDARWADYQATKFERAPDLKLYENAAKARDACTVSAARAALAPAVADDGLAEELVGLIDRSLKDPHVKAVLTRAGMPIGKKIDQQANPALGIAYMGTKFDIDGKKELGIDAVYFFAAEQKSYIRGIGGEVEFAGYPGPLPHGLVLGESRAAVANKLGKPMKTYEDNDYWTPTPNRKLACTFAKGKLVELYIGRPRDY